ncbi:MAG: hypothetical protein WKG01_13935 [Kofleriaceae bacterium]
MAGSSACLCVTASYRITSRDIWIRSAGVKVEHIEGEDTPHGIVSKLGIQDSFLR